MLLSCPTNMLYRPKPNNFNNNGSFFVRLSIHNKIIGISFPSVFVASSLIVSIFSKMNDAGTHNIVHAFTRGAFGARMDVQFVKGGNFLVTGGPYDNYGLGNNWTHLLFSSDGSKLHLYVNGVLKGSSRDIPAGMSIVPSNGKVRIGTGSDTSNPNLLFMGKMADFRLYNRALGRDEIHSLHHAGPNSAN